MWGDKDTFGLAFAAAGKAHLFSQVAVPPGKSSRMYMTNGYDMGFICVFDYCPYSSCHFLNHPFEM